MAKANFVKSAQKNIYKIGKIREYVSEKGKRKGETKSVRDKTIPADEGDEILIAKGESYYWWQFKNSPKQFSKERPKNSQLTQSEFMSQLYAIEEKIEEFHCETREEFEEFRDEVKDEIEQLRDECQEKLDAMPEHLQDSSSSGELLNERIEAMDSWASEIENIECDVDEDEIREELKEEYEVSDNDDEDNDDEGEGDDDDDDSTEEEDAEYKEKISEDEFEAHVTDKIQEKVDEAIEELKNASHGL